MSYASRVLANKYSRNLIFVVGIVVVAAIWFLNRDVQTYGARGEDIYIGQVASVHYYGPAEYESTGIYRKTTLDLKYGAGRLYLCGDQESRFVVGHNYRVDAKTILWKHPENFDNCQRIVHVEDIGNHVDADHISGRILSLTPGKSFLNDMFGGVKYTFELGLEDSKHNKHSVTLCDDDLGPAVNDAYSVLHDLQNKVGWDAMTVFFNKADQSRQYGCYPLLTLRNDKTGILVLSRYIPMLYSDQNEILRQFGILIPLTQGQTRGLLAQTELGIPSVDSIVGQNPGSIVEVPMLRPRFEKLLGSSLADFEARLEVSGLTERNGDWVVGMGLMPHSGGTDDAAYAINVHSGNICAVMRVNREVKTYGVNTVAELPPPLISWLNE